MALPLLAPDTPWPELHLLELLDRGNRLARERLERFGTVWPFGIYVTPSGHVHPLESEPRHYPLPDYLQYEMLHDRLVELAWQERLIAYVLAARIALPPEIDAARKPALRVHFESPETSIYMYTPFDQPTPRGRVVSLFETRRTRYGDAFTTRALPLVFDGLTRKVSTL
ncbi:hypothetical protein [Methyloversatilis thermotolerans]|uniref:hypothetical protein n=1 Tax=Methyloversatilis thermotolerans TaxID=1346290 RepID=UPI0003A73756|nr:hypothetical protein [Methyloversatilis thermotolerans]